MPIEPINFTNGNVQIALDAPDSLPLVGEALVQNKPFPPEAFNNGAISLGSIGAKASAAFSPGPAKVKFGGNIGGSFGVYRSATALHAVLKTRGMDEPMIDRLNFPQLTTGDLYAMQWNYGATASVSGDLALGVGVSFGASGRHEGFFALVRLLDRTTKARDAIQETLSSWKLPRQIADANDLDEGTWVIAETEGSISLSLGVKYGYDYSWMSETLHLGGLSGDLGLKIEMAVGASLGFSASGRFATVISREGAAKKLRLQVFKMRQHGWTFAFDAAISAEKQGSLPPEDFEEFIKSVFNVKDLQVLKDIEKWLDPNIDTASELGTTMVNYLQKMFTELTGVTPAKIDEVLDWLREPIEKWHALPNQVASLVSDLLKKNTPLDELKAFLNRVVSLTDEQELKDEIISRLLGADFFDTTPGRWLTAIAGEGILSLLANFETQRATVIEYAELTLAVLDGDLIETRIKELQQWIEEKLGLEAILAVAKEADFNTLDTWLKKRLSDFLAKQIDFSAVKEIQKAIKKFREKNVIKDFYEKGLKALSEKYTAEIHYAFQKTTTRTALVDLTFDFDANAVNAAKYLKLALGGKFQEVLESPIAGIELNQASLTHELKRRTYLEVGLPYFKRSVEHITESIASGEIVDTADGRLWILSLKAMDEVKKKTSLSRLSVAVQVVGNSGVRTFDDKAFKYDYVLLLGKRKADRKYLETRLEDVCTEYFDSQFSGAGKGTFSSYLTDVDKALDENGGVGGSDKFGTTLASLQVSLPGSVLAAWQKAPKSSKDFLYFAMSRQVQRLLRRWMIRCFVQNTKQYHETAVIFPLLAYSSLPAINGIKFVDGEPFITMDTVHDWDYLDSRVRSAVFSKFSVPGMKELLAGIRSELNAAEDSWVSEYRDDRIGSILSLSNSSSGTTNIKERNFEILVAEEKKIIKDIVKTGTTFGRFVEEKNIEKALEELAKFGSRLTDAFNGNLAGLYTRGSAMRPLGALLMIEVARIFDKDRKVDPAAMLELKFLKEASTFDPADFLAGKNPPSEDIAIQHRILDVV